MTLFIKQKQTHKEQTCDCQRGGRGEVRMDWKFGLSRQKLLCIGWINNKVLLYSTGDYIQYTESLCCTSATNIINQLYFSKKKKKKKRVPNQRQGNADGGSKQDPEVNNNLISLKGK